MYKFALAWQISRLSRTSLYREVAAGRLTAKKIAGRALIDLANRWTNHTNAQVTRSISGTRAHGL